jgi:hypothetical protein
VGLAPLVVLALWVPALALAILLKWHTLWLSLPLLFIALALVRVAWRQLGALRQQRYHHPPYSGAVARLAIELRKKEILRALHVAEPDVAFVAEGDRGDAGVPSDHRFGPAVTPAEGPCRRTDGGSGRT